MYIVFHALLNNGWNNISDRLLNISFQTMNVLLFYTTFQFMINYYYSEWLLYYPIGFVNSHFLLLVQLRLLQVR